MRFYLATCEFKWTHVGTRMENVWVQRELGDELYRQCNTTGFTLHMQHTASQTLPSDVYCSCDIYVDVEDEREAVLIALRGEVLAHKREAPAPEKPQSG